MIDPTFEIRKYYIELLSDISVDAVNIATQDKEPPFVYISTRAQWQGTKTSESYLVSTTFNIVVKTDGNWGGDKLAEDIAAEITPLLGSGDTTENFKIVTMTIEASDPIGQMTETGRVIQKVIVVQNLVSRIVNS